MGRSKSDNPLRHELDEEEEEEKEEEDTYKELKKSCSNEKNHSDAKDVHLSYGISRLENKEKPGSKEQGQVGQ